MRFDISLSLLRFPQILFSADDEMDESDEDDVRRLTGVKMVKKKKLRMGIPVWPACLALLLGSKSLRTFPRSPTDCVILPSISDLQLQNNTLYLKLLYHWLLEDSYMNFFFLAVDHFSFLCFFFNFFIIVYFKHGSHDVSVVFQDTGKNNEWSYC